MKTYNKFIAEARDAKDYKGEKDSDKEAIGFEARSKGEKKFQDYHLNRTKKIPHPTEKDVDKDDKVKKNTKSQGVETNSEGEKSQLKSYEKFKKMGGFGKSSYRPADNIDGDKKMPKVSDGVTQVTEMVSAGEMKLADGSKVRLSDPEAKSINKSFSKMDAKTREKMDKELKKNKESFKNIISFLEKS